MLKKPEGKKTKQNAQQPTEFLAPSEEILHQLSSKDYFEYFGIGSYLKDSLSLFLEINPSSKYKFFSDYFSRVQQGTSALIRAARFILIAPMQSETFMENVTSAYSTLGGPNKLTGKTFSALIQKLFEDQKPQLLSFSTTFTSQWVKRSDLMPVPISFQEFVAGVVQTLSFFDVVDEAINEAKKCEGCDGNLIPETVANKVIFSFTGRTHSFLQNSTKKSKVDSSISASSSTAASSSDIRQMITIDDFCVGLFLELMEAVDKCVVEGTNEEEAHDESEEEDDYDIDDDFEFRFNEKED
ncbi:putative tubulin polyglutamylase complex subunit 1 [Monocercomonoides exilis]|uniref:putative tubulin polyglutamylase complex subunit 1 n=1 Tax=Monocercomonoides exilis TaxID=2049356 RepID=UPI00355A8C84|nr:putative tubulin polyglutamylase complex subunit 1 [Monocercomonoides exilis]|eukprot:MONOS_5746.1-p1 / transcript=MONOS_5746.1 / gene=MONOS_5746 / organism=Monocercomonoides_exilis_PA203 / gene_product=unspecified product / transcript_product=unspecified product / location=Mono_scaffold00172:1661-2847(+) / protein_length=298 / sequence_SO=supercontig / SO=protein_coding / is_pseudo=false